MTSIPTMSDGTQPRQWGITSQTLIVSASAKRVLAVLNGREPLVLPPGSVLHLGDPFGALVVTKVSVIVGEDGGAVCLEAEPEPLHYRAPEGLDHPAQRPRYLRPVPSQPVRRSPARPGNG